jgi:two-component system, NarL family, sensor histidine kinase UhpB
VRTGPEHQEGVNKLREGGIGGILDGLPVLISYTDVEGRFLYGNSALLRACGKPLDTPAGLHARELLGEVQYARCAAHMKRVVRGETVTFLDSNDAGGEPRHLELTFVPDFGAQGNVQGFFGIGYDLTARVQREASVASSEQQLRGILRTMAEALVIHDREGRVIEANPAAEEMLSLTREQLLGWNVARPYWKVVDEYGAPLAPEQLPVIRTLRTGEPLRGQIVGIHIENAPVRWISVNAHPLYDGRDKRPSGVVGTFADVTALRDSLERIRQLAQRMEDVREQERRELALLLHEGLAQDLFSMRLAVGNQLRGSHDAQSHLQALQDLSRVLDRCLADTRQLASGLRPTGPVDRPIGQVIAQHARYFEGLSKLRIQLFEGAAPAISDEPMRLLLFRAAQEALSNVARHARATRVDVHLESIGEQVELRVADDGIGLAPGSLDKPGSLGLLGIRERARAVGGTFTIDRNAGGGTTLVLRLPVTAG